MNANRYEPVKIGVVGMGQFGALHALTALGLAETELVAVVARRQQSLDDFAAQAPGVPGYLDLEGREGLAKVAKVHFKTTEKLRRPRR